ncbi:putative lipid-A-disaccharide synthase [Nymphaea thermarum]|nr:putative lipid-A-disaccharide synthase [Nymphaea thermarum]
MEKLLSAATGFKRRLLLLAAKNGHYRRSLSSCNGRRRVVDMAMEDKELRLFVVAGEPSGDAIAARLISSLHRLSPSPLRLAGVGGPMMKSVGLNSLFRMEDLAVMGLLELLPHLSKIRMRLQQAIEAAIQFQPHAVITVDAKGFSFRFLKLLRDKCSLEPCQSPIHIHYVAPSFWAWKGGESRLKALSGYVDHLLCILPFEVDVLRAHGLDATFVGHPILEDALNFHPDNEADAQPIQVKVPGNGAYFRQKHGISPGATIVTVIPGSREQEVTRMLPIYMNTLELLKDSLPSLTVVIPVASNLHVQSYLYKLAPSRTLPTILIPGESVAEKYDAFHASSAALCTSGTAVLELQLARLPCIVAYRAHLLTEWIIRLKTKMHFISLPNILMDSQIIPEALFSSCNPMELSMLLSQIIHDDGIRKQQIVSADKVLNLLCPSKENPSYSNYKQFLSAGSDFCPSNIAASAVLCSERR